LRQSVRDEGEVVEEDVIAVQAGAVDFEAGDAFAGKGGETEERRCIGARGEGGGEFGFGGVGKARGERDATALTAATEHADSEGFYAFVGVVAFDGEREFKVLCALDFVCEQEAAGSG
jgi:hypothetical protein